MNYGDLLRKRREELGLTQAQLAKLSGIDQTMISRIETGRTKIVTKSTEKIVEALLLKLAFVEIHKRKPDR